MHTYTYRVRMHSGHPPGRGAAEETHLPQTSLLQILQSKERGAAHIYMLLICNTYIYFCIRKRFHFETIPVLEYPNIKSTSPRKPLAKDIIPYRHTCIHTLTYIHPFLGYKLCLLDLNSLYASHTFMCKCIIHVCINTCIHTYMHTYIHT